ncbi:hypothetical protein GCM10007320_30380 [Pseudorhodoferax aquiterrae]|uniref:Uncharacterized protein n=1 Tax=Pseudorhodoferax aquiterrae TaxID=747304 RepID=A0ABQ3G3H6_9BURK|nr:hypothetical protein GCM10007320_30380 [Pseudorhodoferax aquiterrae]
MERALRIGGDPALAGDAPLLVATRAARAYGMFKNKEDGLVRAVFEP